MAHRAGRLLLTMFAALIALPGTALMATAQHRTADQETAAAPTAGVQPDSPDETARRTGKRVELLGRTNESTQVFVEPNGLHTMEQYAEPVRARKGQKWVPIDTKLAFRRDGSVQPGATPTTLRLSGGGAGTSLAALGRGSSQIRMGWRGKLPRPVLSGDTATYREVLPGVDLQVRAGKTGFSQLLVVKNRAAAANPRLRELRFPLSGTGVTFTSQADGSTVAKDGAGTTVFRSAAPMMWDKPKAAVGEADADVQVRTMPVKQAGGNLVIRPDVALLTGPTTRFPVFIDPPWDTGWQFWSHVNEMSPNESYWAHNPIKDRDRAKVGYSYDRAVRYRSFFQFRTEGLNGARVIKAQLNITLDHSPDGVSRPIDMYLTYGIHPDNWLSWNNSKGHWIRWLAQASGFARTHDMAMGFGGENVKRETQAVADSRGGQITFGLRAPDEGSNLQWKKFHPDAKFVVSYNNGARTPQKVNFSRPLKCGTQAAPAMINTTTPSFSAVASDPDGDNLTTRLGIHRAGTDAIEFESDSAVTSSGAAFAWPAVPAGELTNGGTYYFVARSNDNVPDDGIEFSAESPRCYFTVDTDFPAEPSIESSDFPNGEPGPVKAWETGIVTLRPAAGDTDIAEYRFGSQQDKLTSRIKANSDGTAQLPQVVWPDGSQVPTRRLYVKAVDAAGNPSPTTDAYDLSPLENDRPQKVRGDITGDGRADVNLVLDHGFGRTAVWNLTAKEGGFNNATMAWDSDVNGGFALYRTRAVQGDFDDVGGADIALFREEAGRRVSLHLLKSDGNRYDAQNPPLWNSGSAGWALSTARVLGGEVNGDKKSDIVVQLNTNNGGWRTLVFLGGALGSPVEWSRTAAGSGDWAQSAPVLADVDSDGKDDLVELRNLTGCRTVANVYRSSGTGFATTPAQLLDTGAGQYCWEKSKPVAGDVDGDGRDDVIAMYENGANDLSLKVFRSTGTAMTLSDFSRVTSFDPAQVALSVGDYTKDGKDDVALVHSLPDGGREVHTQTSTGTAFGAPVSGWKEPRVGASTGPSFDIEHRTYELVSRGSNKCLEVEGASQALPATFQQWDCNGGLHQRFRIVPQAGTDQYEIHSVHVNVAPTGTNFPGKARCIDVDDQSTGDNVPIVQWACMGTANQQVLIDYIEGSSYDTVIRLKFAHSDKCAAVPNGDTANGADVKQLTCAAGASQQWILRAAFNPTPLDGRYKVSSVLSGFVLDIKNCVADQGIRLWDWVANSPCQSWWVKPLGDDLYQIVDPSTGTAVQTDGCSTDNEGLIKSIAVDQQVGCQSWRIEPANGSHSITQVKTGKALDVPHCGAGKDTHLHIWPYWNGPCQQWRMERVGNPPTQ